MIEIPVIRWGQPYESLEKADVVHFETGEVMAQIHQANAGLVVNYIATSVYQTVKPLDFAMLVRGEDRFNHFEDIPEPRADFHPDALAFHQRMMNAHNEVIYDGAANKASSATHQDNPA